MYSVGFVQLFWTTLRWSVFTESDHRSWAIKFKKDFLVLQEDMPSSLSEKVTPLNVLILYPNHILNVLSPFPNFLWYYRHFLADSWAQNRSPEGLQMTYFLKLNLHLEWVTLGDSASLVYPSIFHTGISSRFFATGFRSFKFFSKFEVR